MTTKKHLTDKFNPKMMINSLKLKHKDTEITEKDGTRKNPDTMSTDLFSHTVAIEKIGVRGFAEETSKKMAQQRAC